MRESMVLVGAIMIILGVSLASTNYLIDTEVPTRLFEVIREQIDSKLTFLILLNIFLLALGMMLDIFSALVIVVPIILPIAVGYGIHPVHLGIIFLANMQIGYTARRHELFIASYRFEKPVMGRLPRHRPVLLDPARHGADHHLLAGPEPGAATGTRLGRLRLARGYTVENPGGRTVSQPTLDTIDIIRPENYGENGYPHEAWKLLRREAPIHYWERGVQNPFWAVTKHEDIISISKQPRRFQNGPAHGRAGRREPRRAQTSARGCGRGRGPAGRATPDPSAAEHGPARARQVPQGRERLVHTSRHAASRRGGRAHHLGAARPAGGARRRGRLRRRRDGASHAVGPGRHAGRSARGLAAHVPVDQPDRRLVGSRLPAAGQDAVRDRETRARVALQVLRRAGQAAAAGPARRHGDRGAAGAPSTASRCRRSRTCPTTWCWWWPATRPRATRPAEGCWS